MLDVVKNLLVLLVSSSLVSNVVLSQFLGLCPFLGVSKKVNTAVGMGGAVIFVITIASGVTAVIYRFVLVTFDITYLQTIVFILVIAALVQFVEMFLKKYVPSLYQALGVYLPLITTNCAVLGIALTNVQKSYGIGFSIASGLFTAVGFLIAIVILAGIREMIAYNDIPEFYGEGGSSSCSLLYEGEVWRENIVKRFTWKLADFERSMVNEYFSNFNCIGCCRCSRFDFGYFPRNRKHCVSGGS